MKVRKVDFKYDDKEIDRFYFKKNPFSTHFVNTLHLLFPDGERFFINSMLQFSGRFNNEKIRKDVKSFCGQEGIHSIEHEKIVQILQEKGYKTEPYLKSVRWILDKFGKGLTTKLAGETGPLIVTSSLEHFTALFAESMLKDINTDGVDERMVELFKWHACEEIEHKSVAFNLLNEVDEDEYKKRIVIMPLATFILYAYLTGGTIYFMVQDADKIELKKLPAHLYEFIFQFLKQFHKSTVKEYFNYYKKDFHPDKHDNYFLAQEFLSNKSYK